MAKFATHFHPTTETFGDLTLRARRMSSQFLSVTWTGVNDGIDRVSQSRAVVGAGFLTIFMLFLISLGMVDQALFSQASAQRVYGGVALEQPTAPEAQYGSMPLDYD